MTTSSCHFICDVTSMQGFQAAFVISETKDIKEHISFVIDMFLKYGVHTHNDASTCLDRHSTRCASEYNSKDERL
jgi:hypothetical protein